MIVGRHGATSHEATKIATLASSFCVFNGRWGNSIRFRALGLYVVWEMMGNNISARLYYFEPGMSQQRT